MTVLLNPAHLEPRPRSRRRRAGSRLDLAGVPRRGRPPRCLPSSSKYSKTTLLALLLDRIMQGKGWRTRSPKSARVCFWNRPGPAQRRHRHFEEDETLWRRRQRRLDFRPDVGFWWILSGRPTLEHSAGHVRRARRPARKPQRRSSWSSIRWPCSYQATKIVRLAARRARRLPGLLTQTGLAVLLCTTPGQEGSRIWPGRRGTARSSAFGDILLELRVPKGDAVRHRTTSIFGF